MIFLIALAASAALVALQEPTDVNGNGLDPACKNEKLPYATPPFRNVEMRYVYNETTRLCREVMIDKNRNNTFGSRHECVSKCQTGQGAEYCLGEPLDICNGPNGTNTVPIIRLPGSGIRVYFYNLTTMKCENYSICGYPKQWKNISNFFVHRSECNLRCGNFSAADICENKTKPMY